jgi:hypothetical protein
MTVVELLDIGLHHSRSVFDAWFALDPTLHLHPSHLLRQTREYPFDEQWDDLAGHEVCCHTHHIRNHRRLDLQSELLRNGYMTEHRQCLRYLVHQNDLEHQNEEEWLAVDKMLTSEVLNELIPAG